MVSVSDPKMIAEIYSRKKSLAKVRSQLADTKSLVSDPSVQSRFYFVAEFVVGMQRSESLFSTVDKRHDGLV